VSVLSQKQGEKGPSEIKLFGQVRKSERFLLQFKQNVKPVYTRKFKEKNCVRLPKSYTIEVKKFFYEFIKAIISWASAAPIRHRPG
jgi:hypothetical protein